jgi:5-formyltetrahydrofolate cyclo-ligase
LHPSAKKQQLRIQAKAARLQLSLYTRHQAALALVPAAKTVAVITQAQRIGLYLAHQSSGELDPWVLLQYLSPHKQCFLPLIQPDGSLRFAPYQANAKLQENCWHILEPCPQDNIHNSLPASALEIICVPVLLFDQQGYRLGMGGAYYDRSLQAIQQQQTRPYLLGLAYASAGVSTLPREPWDVRLDQVLAV